MDKRKLKFAVVSIMTVLVGVGTGFLFFSNSHNNQTNVSHDEVIATQKNAKLILSKGWLCDAQKISSLDQNIDNCDVAITGEIVDIIEEQIEMRTGIPEADKKFEEEGFPKLNITKYKIKVNDVYKGKIKDTFINYEELGKIDELVTKPKNKEKVFLFLKKYKNTYSTVGKEHSIFTYDNNGVVYSY